MSGWRRRSWASPPFCTKAEPPPPATLTPAMPAQPERELNELCQRLLSTWAPIWNRPALEDSITVEVSTRLERALARALPERRVVRLAAAVAQGPETGLAEVLCHEAAHLVVHERHGRQARPHGREWAQLMRAAGYSPRVRVDPAELGIVMPKRRRRAQPRRRRYLYEHRCPVCQTQRMAGRPVRQWRCEVCSAAGLSGELEVWRWPRRDRDRVERTLSSRLKKLLSFQLERTRTRHGSSHRAER